MAIFLEDPRYAPLNPFRYILINNNFPLFEGLFTSMYPIYKCQEAKKNPVWYYSQIKW
ncbi:hypothetical protein HETIRDRAFT_163241 [Heterobasidion irregulare TC 32-1]|uniref:Uncharacterized protein n=1 Tax=Heterobasidion irregulare (strain TC 32-1) TaxID=747525 RepID=W4KAS8_HETIT|nr:uncharacterized protein HETIRDRAFT_163241 [Heterobasidion irregulare TC 32-1]ETW82824.1 hypothetical protein HETIRDRAFT_163241 [Heterobasidion irregulare TC 32-1]